MFIADTHADTLYEMGWCKNASPCITPKTLSQGNVSLQVLALWTGRDGNKGDVEGIVSA
ncbi:MAG: hypothetical protein Q4C54_04010 [Clostridia bacterium]|nr:hypothetical protein [Clostridia bacterium]